MMIAGIFFVQYQQVRLLERIASSMAPPPICAANDISISWCSNGSMFTLCISGPNPGESTAEFAERAGKELEVALKAHPKTNDC